MVDGMSSDVRGGDPKTRETILRCALARLQQGKPFRLSPIARDAGVSRQGVYLHFRDRAALLDATVDFGNQQLGVDARIALLLQEPDPVRALRDFIALWVWQVHRAYPLLCAVRTLIEQDEQIGAAWASRRGRADLMRQITRRLHQQQRLKPGLSPTEAGDILSALMTVGPAAELVLRQGWPVGLAAKTLQQAAAALLLAKPDEIR